MIKATKTSLACWNVDTQAIWERFVVFNKARGNTAVPAGFLLGFMRKWRACPAAKQRYQARFDPVRHDPPQSPELVALIKAAPTANRHFHESDLCRKIGKLAYEERVQAKMARLGCLRFPAMLAVHGLAIRAGEISR